MRFGICTATQNINTVANMGFDYIELAANTLSLMSNTEFEEVRSNLNQSNMKCEAANCLLPGEIKIIGKDCSTSSYLEYLKHTLYRLSKLEIKVVVFGSGNSRRVPENVTFEKAREQLFEFSTHLAELAAQNGIQVAVEPLNFRETNILLTQDESAQLVRKINRESFKLLLDVFHFAFEVLPFTEIHKWKDELVHIHIARPFTRELPSLNDGFDYQPFFAALKSINYDNKISIEAGNYNMECLQNSLSYLKKLFGNESKNGTWSYMNK